MRKTALFRGAALVASVVIGLDITAHVVSAQSVFERMKRAAEEATRKAREGQPPKPPPQTPQTSQPSNPPNTSAPPSEAASGDCCSPDALRQIASSAGFLDIVGIKLGMTPEQAFAAVKAFNGQMKIDIVNARVEDPEPSAASPEFPSTRLHTRLACGPTRTFRLFSCAPMAARMSS
jgi:hypothetical protein